MASYDLKQKIGRARESAKREVAAAVELRENLRRRQSPRSPMRQEELREQIERLSEANRQLRPYVMRIQWRQFEIDGRLEQRLRETSKAVIRERQKLRKMLP